MRETVKEEWKILSDENPDYAVSNLGRVRKGKKIIKKRSDPNGYERVSIAGYGRERVHRLVAKYFIENDDPENKIYINHIDGCPQNNFYLNLEWCTPGENLTHAYRTGLIDTSKRNYSYIVETNPNTNKSKIYLTRQDIAQKWGLEVRAISRNLSGVTQKCSNGMLYSYLDMSRIDLLKLLGYVIDDNFNEDVVSLQEPREIDLQ